MSTILGLLHNPSNSLQAHTKTMAPSSNQASTTPNKTNPDLRLTLESPNSPPLTPSLNNHSPTPQTYEQEMEMLEQLWSGLSLEHTFEGTVSYVRIPVHPRAAMQWNQMTQTPSLPLRLDPPPPPSLPPLSQPPFPYPGPQDQPLLSHPDKAITSSTGQAVEHPDELLQCSLPGPSARNHFPLLGSRQGKHCNARRRT